MSTFYDGQSKKVRNALFVYDGPIQKDSQGNYYSTVINNTVFNRYLGHAEHLAVAIRTQRFCDDSEVRKTQKIDLTNVNVIDVPNISSVSGILFSRNKACSILRNELNKADVAIIRLPSFIGAEAVRLARKLRKKYLVEVVGCPFDSLWNYGLKGKLIAPYLVLSMKAQVKKADYVIYVTNNFLQERYPTKGKSINCSNVEIATMEEGILEQRLLHIKLHKRKIIL